MIWVDPYSIMQWTIGEMRAQRLQADFQHCSCSELLLATEVFIMNLGPEINLQVVIKSQRLNFPFDLLQVALVDEIFPKQNVGKKHKHGQGTDHNGKNLVPSKTGPGTRSGDDGRSGGLDGRHMQRAGGGRTRKQLLHGAPGIAAEQVLVGAKAILLVGDAAVVEDALLEAGSGAGWHGLEVD